ncbi:methylthioribose-1-phosphate isomerase [Thiolapillus brandeum]|uniref:Methylthioribose-1-phosphate isomerase n=2 Tax=Thiolapillus brandeum TaxID=1076588 RepID=A0A7U6GJZ2_9GAMM|nr:methylthioribose-1-phosphate isomerase [Thiolapillus brandeum]
MDADLLLLDQRLLPHEEKFIHCENAEDTARAVTDMVVRGAPAIGVTAAYGMVLAARHAWRQSGADWKTAMQGDVRTLAAARPTAVNLGWAIARMDDLLRTLPGDADPEPALLAEARAIHEEDVAANHVLGDLGASLIEGRTSVITHCNAGALATGGYGTALGVIRSAWKAGKLNHVYADETRPWLQGSRLTAWEMVRDGIPVSLLADGAAAARLAAGGVTWVVVGSDRIAANGDVANKIGTYSLALVARAHGVKVMVAAPTSTIDMNCPSGADIPIETRDPGELLACGGSPVASAGAQAWNPVFDVTPAELVDAIVTERGIISAPDARKLAMHMA